MANDAVFQARINKQVKQDVEELYRSMGTTFSEAVRVFAQQSLLLGRMPFDIISAEKATERRPLRPNNKRQDLSFNSAVLAEDSDESAFGMFAAYANPEIRKREKDAWHEAAIEKHRNFLAQEG